MRAYSITSTLVASIFGLCLIFLTAACKKDSEKSATDSTFSFTYNGTHYVLPFKEGTPEWGIELAGIFINRPDLFNGTIHFPYTNCAYLEPTNVFGLSVSPDCELSIGLGRPIDSVAVYMYRSGSVKRLSTNCSYKSTYDLITGRTRSYSVCDVIGTFDLILKNKQNKTIEITEGNIEMYRIAR